MTDMPTNRVERAPFRHTTDRPRHRRARSVVRAAAGLSIVAVTVASCGGDDDGIAADPIDSVAGLDLSEPGEADRSDPAAVIEDYRIAYNSGDIERVMALFAADAELSRHPFATASIGLVAIRNVQLRDLSVAAPSDAYKMFDVEVSGDTVSWDHEFTNADGDRWCGHGNVAVVKDGRIESWAFAPNPRRC